MVQRRLRSRYVRTRSPKRVRSSNAPLPVVEHGSQSSEDTDDAENEAATPAATPGAENAPVMTTTAQQSAANRTTGPSAPESFGGEHELATEEDLEAIFASDTAAASLRRVGFIETWSDDGDEADYSDGVD